MNAQHPDMPPSGWLAYVSLSARRDNPRDRADARGFLRESPGGHFFVMTADSVHLGWLM